MKRKQIILQHRTSVLLVIGLVFVMPFVLGSGCSTDANGEKQEALATTIWKLDYIQAKEGSIFPNESDSIWIPDSFHYLNFISSDTVTNQPGAYLICKGSYQIDDIDKIDIDWNCFTDRGGALSDDYLIASMIDSANSFRVNQQSLQLFVNATEQWSQNTMHFVHFNEER